MVKTVLSAQALGILPTSLQQGASGRREGVGVSAGRKGGWGGVGAKPPGGPDPQAPGRGAVQGQGVWCPLPAMPAAAQPALPCSSQPGPAQTCLLPERSTVMSSLARRRARRVLRSPMSWRLAMLLQQRAEQGAGVGLRACVMERQRRAGRPGPQRDGASGAQTGGAAVNTQEGALFQALTWRRRGRWSSPGMPTAWAGRGCLHEAAPGGRDVAE